MLPAPYRSENIRLQGYRQRLHRRHQPQERPVPGIIASPTSTYAPCIPVPVTPHPEEYDSPCPSSGRNLFGRHLLRGRMPPSACPPHDKIDTDNRRATLKRHCRTTLYVPSEVRCGNGSISALRPQRPPTDPLHANRRKRDFSFPPIRILHESLRPPHTRPAKPMNAIARIPAVTSATGTPRIARGTSLSSSRSRMPEKTTSARAKPTAVETA